MTVTIALANQKGGVGKTTTAYNLARAAHTHQIKTLVIDMDPQGNLTSALAAEPLAEDRPGVADALHSRAPEQLSDVLVETAWSQVTLAPTVGEALAFVRDEMVIAGAGRESRLLEALAHHNGSLQYLYLSGNALTPATLPGLRALLARKPSLKGLYLSVNLLGDAGALGIADALKRNTALEFLGVASCGIGDAGLAALLAAAAGHPRLVSLDLGDAPSARVLGASPNMAGPLAHRAALNLLELGRPLRSLNLPRMPGAAELMDLSPPDLRLNITGARPPAPQPALPVHEDASDVRSVYR